MSLIPKSYIYSHFELYFMGDENTPAQAVTMSIGARELQYEKFFAGQKEYDAAIKEAVSRFGSHIDSYWPGSIGGFQVVNGNDALMVIQFWVRWLREYGFGVGRIKLVMLDEHGGFPPTTDQDKHLIDRYEEAVSEARDLL